MNLRIWVFRKSTESFLDLGVSSYQLDNEERGFTYRVDAPLDMRMDQRQSRTAADIVNGYDEKELYRIIRDYGEDKFAKILRSILWLREQRHRFRQPEN